MVRVSAAWKAVLLDPGDSMKSLPRRIQVRRYYHFDILQSNIYLKFNLNAINYNYSHLGWVFGLTAENAENAQGLRAESISSMSSFNSAESANTKDKLSKLRYVNKSLSNII